MTTAEAAARVRQRISLTTGWRQPVTAGRHRSAGYLPLPGRVSQTSGVRLLTSEKHLT
ncbi:hypothetical protein [Actinophytocola xinjiangensis]|uniref:hypothetical protein n=1 Tax=Actinophytocola xinjiangensis TaxID=485602 RepID=UPI000A4F79F3|nr:hypothetical protein [Actinophytocola xinjiangensis]